MAYKPYLFRSSPILSQRTCLANYDEGLCREVPIYIDANQMITTIDRDDDDGQDHVYGIGFACHHSELTRMRLYR